MVMKTKKEIIKAIELACEEWRYHEVRWLLSRIDEIFDKEAKRECTCALCGEEKVLYWEHVCEKLKGGKNGRTN